MFVPVLCAATLALGVQVGWQPLPDGGVEYLIQIEPEMLDALKAGQPVGSDIPINLLKDVRSFRITVGREKLPQITPPPRSDPEPAARPAATPSVTLPEPTAPSRYERSAAPSGSAPTYRNTPGPGITGGLPAFPSSDPLPTPKIVNPADRSPAPPSTYAPGSPGQPPSQPAPGSRGAFSSPTLTPGTSALAANSEYSPRTIAPDPASRPLGERHATYLQGRPDETAGFGQPTQSPFGSQSQTPLPAIQTEEAHPWWALTLTGMALAASLTWNAYLCWLLYQARRRYKTLLSRVSQTAQAVVRTRPVASDRSEDAATDEYSSHQHHRRERRTV